MEGDNLEDNDFFQQNMTKNQININEQGECWKSIERLK